MFFSCFDIDIYPGLEHHFYLLIVDDHLLYQFPDKPLSIFHRLAVLLPDESDQIINPFDGCVPVCFIQEQ